MCRIGLDVIVQFAMPHADSIRMPLRNDEAPTTPSGNETFTVKSDFYLLVEYRREALYENREPAGQSQSTARPWLADASCLPGILPR